jgi:hypothetical protein
MSTTARQLTPDMLAHPGDGHNEPRGDGLAYPLHVSVGYVKRDVVERLGYILVGVCVECRRAIVVTSHGAHWTHRDNGDRACNSTLTLF